MTDPTPPVLTGETMLERVSRAIEREKMKPFEWTDDEFEVWWTRDSRNVHKDDRMAEARAALEAIREPTPNMISAAVNTPGMTAVNHLISNQYARTGHDALAGHGEAPLIQAWKAMVDAMLGEAPRA